MGKPIVYCHACGRSLREEDFDKGKAHTSDHRPYCTDCKPLAPAPAPAPIPAPRHSSQRIVLPAGKSLFAGPRPATPPPAKSPVPIFVAAGAGGLVLLLLIVLAARGQRPRPRPSAVPEAADASAPSPVPPPPSEPSAPAGKRTPLAAGAKLENAKAAAVVEKPPPPVRVESPAPPPPPKPVEPAKPSPPPPKEPDPAAARWRAALAHATARDYAAALRELRQGTDAAADVDLLGRLAERVQEAIETLARTPKGQKLALEFVNGSGAAERAEGTVVRSGPHRVELAVENRLTAVEFGELTAPFLAGLVLKKSPASAALLRLLEGDLEGPGDLSIPPRYLDYAKHVSETRALVDPKEAEARKLFHQARDGYLKPATTVEAVQKLRKLLAEGAETATVRRNRASIAERLQGGKEYAFLAADLAGAGAFSLTRHNRAETCWLSDRDGDPAKIKENYVDVVFSVLPETEYRCWVYVGGCCMETISFSLQGSELSGKVGKDTAVCEPGGDAVLPARLPTLSLRRLHSMHTGPKEPDRWIWLPVALPKYATAGPKTVRLLSAQKGFAVAYAFVSAVKTAPPREAELKELEKLRGVAAPVAPAAPPDPDLVGWWRFEEGSGAKAADASRNRNDGTLINGPSWVEGRIGRALGFDGTDDCFKVPESDSLKGTTTQLTIAAWVLRRSNQPGWKYVVSRSLGSTSGDQYWLAFDNNRYAFGVETTSGEKGALAGTAPNGQWLHMAGTYDGAKVRLYVNGAEVASADGTGPIRLESPRAMTVGARLNNESGAVGWALDARVDEVYLYKRVLTPAEIQALAAAAPQPAPAAAGAPLSSEGLVGHWRLDEESGTTAADASGSGRAGMLEGDAKWGPGKVKGGLVFGGTNGCVNIPDAPDLNPSSLTLAAWVYVPSVPKTMGNILSKGENQGYRIRVGGGMQVEFFDRGVENALKTADNVVPLKQWTHVAATGDAGGLRIYVNGALVASNTRPYGRPVVPHPLTIGAETVFKEYFQGSIDEACLYKRALSAAEVQALTKLGPKMSAPR